MTSLCSTVSLLPTDTVVNDPFARGGKANRRRCPSMASVVYTVMAFIYVGKVPVLGGIVFCRLLTARYCSTYMASLFIFFTNPNHIRHLIGRPVSEFGIKFLPTG